MWRGEFHGRGKRVVSDVYGKCTEVGNFEYGDLHGEGCATFADNNKNEATGKKLDRMAVGTFVGRSGLRHGTVYILLNGKVVIAVHGCVEWSATHGTLINGFATDARGSFLVVGLIELRDNGEYSLREPERDMPMRTHRRYRDCSGVCFKCPATLRAIEAEIQRVNRGEMATI